ncbi:MAG: hypothetical protein ACUVUD_03605 [bacterium]
MPRVVRLHLKAISATPMIRLITLLLAGMETSGAEGRVLYCIEVEQTSRDEE